MAERVRPEHGRRHSPPPKPVARSPRRSGRDAERWQVVDDLPRPVPVSRAELDVLEAYLGTAIDALLRAFPP